MSMKKLFNFIQVHYSVIYKVFLILVTIVLLVSLFPKKATFKYEYYVGKPLMHADLIALFDFAIEKTDDEIRGEKEAVLKDVKPYFRYDEEIYNQSRVALSETFENVWKKKYSQLISPNLQFKDTSKYKCFEIFDTVFSSGIIESNYILENKTSEYSIIILTDNVAVEKELNDLFTINSASEYIKAYLIEDQSVDVDLIVSVLNASILHNIFYDEETTEREKVLALENISLTHGMVQNGERIISKGELITSDKYEILESLKKT